MSLSPDDFAANVERFSGFAALYDQYRPAPPAVLAAILTRLAQTDIPQRVVDLGSGTALSTRYWADKAHEVIGIEPSLDMRRQAESQTTARNVLYRDGFSHHTGLPDCCAEIVTCSQSLHWMEPQATFEEAARILRPGGVFAAYDYDWPPTTGSWEAGLAYEECLRGIWANEKALGVAAPLQQWEKEGHVARMQASNCFRYVKEIVLHHIEQGNAERFVGILLSQGGVRSLLKRGLTEEDLGIDRFREIANRMLGAEDRPWIWSSRVRFGIARSP